MVTRIPQPQFVGPAPAEVVDQAAQTGSRFAEIASQGVAEGMKNYQAEQEIKARKEMSANQEKSALDQLKLTVEQKHIESLFASADDPAEVYVKNSDEIHQFYKDMYGPAGDAIFDATSEHALQAVKGGTLLKSGALAFQSTQPGATPTQQPQQPFATQPPASGAMSQPNPQTPAVASPGPTTAQPKAQPTAPQAATQLPTDKKEFTPDIIKSLMADQNYMAEIKGKLKQAGIPDVDKLSDSQLLSKYSPRIAELNKTLSGVQPSAAANPSSSGSAMAQTITSISTKGIPKPVLDASIGGFQKIVDAAAGKVTDDLTPKEQAATNRVMSTTVQVMKDSQGYKDFIAAGGTEEIAKRAAQAVQSAIANDPSVLDFYKNNIAMSDREQAKYLAGFKADTQATKVLSDAGIAKEKLADAETRTAYGAYKAYFAVQQLQERIAIEAKKAGALDKKSTEYLTAVVYTQARDAWTTWLTSYQKANPKASQVDIDNAWAKEMQSPGSPTTQAQANAVKLMAPFMGTSPDDATTYLSLEKTYYFPNPFGEGGLGEKTPGGQVPVPGFGAKPDPNHPADPETRAHAAQAPGPAYGSPEWLAQHKM